MRRRNHPRFQRGRCKQRWLLRTSKIPTQSESQITLAAPNASLTVPTVVFPESALHPALRPTPFSPASSSSSHHRQLQELSEWNASKHEQSGIPFTLLWMKNRVVDMWLTRFTGYKTKVEDLQLQSQLLPALLTSFEEKLTQAAPVVVSTRPSALEHLPAAAAVAATHHDKMSSVDHRAKANAHATMKKDEVLKHLAFWRKGANLRVLVEATLQDPVRLAIHASIRWDRPKLVIQASLDNALECALFRNGRLICPFY